MRAGPDAGDSPGDGLAVAVRVRTADGRWVRARAEAITGASSRGFVVVIQTDDSR